MSEDTNIVPFHQPGSVLDPLTEIAREGARRMLMAALKAEADAFVAGFAEDLLLDGRRRVVRHGAGPRREMQTGIPRDFSPFTGPDYQDCFDPDKLLEILRQSVG